MDKPFTSDHCTGVAEYDHAACCVQHDWLYWQGGSIKDRREADLAFYECLQTTTHRARARIRWLGVRIGGVGFVPTPWRWGYGWKWPRSRAPQRDTSPFSPENQRDAYEAALEEARADDRKARGTP